MFASIENPLWQESARARQIVLDDMHTNFGGNLAALARARNLPYNSLYVMLKRRSSLIHYKTRQLLMEAYPEQITFTVGERKETCSSESAWGPAAVHDRGERCNIPANVFLTPSLVERVNELVKHRRINRSEAIRQAIELGLERMAA